MLPWLVPGRNQNREIVFAGTLDKLSGEVIETSRMGIPSSTSPLVACAPAVAARAKANGERIFQAFEIGDTNEAMQIIANKHDKTIL